jgi:hypothetical protein
MFSAILKFFDKLEDKVRVRLSHRSIVYALIGGASTVLFWCGVWHTGDILMQKGGIWGVIFYEPFTIVWTGIILLVTGLFVSNFIGERIVISGLKKEKKVTDRTEEEVVKEDNKIISLNAKINAIAKDVADLRDELANK